MGSGNAEDDIDSNKAGRGQDENNKGGGKTKITRVPNASMYLVPQTRKWNIDGPGRT